MVVCKEGFAAWLLGGTGHRIIRKSVILIGNVDIFAGLGPGAVCGPGGST